MQLLIDDSLILCVQQSSHWCYTTFSESLVIYLSQLCFCSREYLGKKSTLRNLTMIIRTSQENGNQTESFVYWRIRHFISIWIKIIKFAQNNRRLFSDIDFWNIQKITFNCFESTTFYCDYDEYFYLFQSLEVWNHCKTFFVSSLRNYFVISPNAELLYIYNLRNFITLSMIL